MRVRKEIQRPDGSLIKFDDNACVLVNKAGDPIGTRMNGSLQTFFFYLPSLYFSVYGTNAQVLGIVGAELRGKQWSKILSLAPMHV